MLSSHLVKSFVAVARELLQIGAHFSLSEKFSKHPLEEHFANHHLRGGPVGTSWSNDFETTLFQCYQHIIIIIIIIIISLSSV